MPAHPPLPRVDAAYRWLVDVSFIAGKTGARALGVGDSVGPEPAGIYRVRIKCIIGTDDATSAFAAGGDDQHWRAVNAGQPKYLVRYFDCMWFFGSDRGVSATIQYPLSRFS